MLELKRIQFEIEFKRNHDIHVFKFIFFVPLQLKKNNMLGLVYRTLHTSTLLYIIVHKP